MKAKLYFVLMLPAILLSGFIYSQDKLADSSDLVKVERKHPSYLRLKNALSKYQKIKDEGGWKAIPFDGKTIEPGDTSELVKDISERLIVTGDLAVEKSKDSIYDTIVEFAVRRFQARHGIKVDGRVGPATIRNFNIPVEKKIDKLNLTLKAWEELPVDLGERYIFVNVPEFRLEAFNGNEEKLEMKVIVGTGYDGRSTPLFHDSIEYVVFNPYWNIPNSIVLNEILPHARNDISYLSRNNYEMVRWFDSKANVLPTTYHNLRRLARGEVLLRQKSGPNNALGNIKFIFPNKYAVYLHGTPADHLFDRAERDFSHGCIRVEDPVALAEFILKRNDGNWSREKIEAEVANPDWNRLDLQEKLPVYIVYWTAFVEQDGKVNFREDIYNRNT